jgi:hypothetical protein
MLLYGAIQPAVRPLVLIVAGTSKMVFIGLVLSEGAELFPRTFCTGLRESSSPIPMRMPQYRQPLMRTPQSSVSRWRDLNVVDTSMSEDDR